jgi:hypothetical protein
VPAFPIDDLLDTSRGVGGLLYKIDTEGWEAQVLRGMSSTLELARWSIGIIEFDSENLERAGDDPVEVLAEIAKGSVVAVLHLSGTLERLDAYSPWASLQAIAATGENMRVDLLRASDEDAFAALVTVLR